MMSIFEEAFFNRIIHGRCEQVMKEIPDNSIDLVVTSPPYNLKKFYREWNEMRQGRKMVQCRTYKWL